MIKTCFWHSKTNAFKTIHLYIYNRELIHRRAFLWEVIVNIKTQGISTLSQGEQAKSIQRALDVRIEPWSLELWGISYGALLPLQRASWSHKAAVIFFLWLYLSITPISWAEGNYHLISWSTDRLLLTIDAAYVWNLSCKLLLYLGYICATCAMQMYASVLLNYNLCLFQQPQGLAFKADWEEKFFIIKIMVLVMCSMALDLLHAFTLF